VAARDDDRYVRLHTPYAVEHLTARQSRQEEVEHDEVDGGTKAHEQLVTLATVGRGVYRIALAFERHCPQRAYHVVVVDDKHRFRAAGKFGRRVVAYDRFLECHRRQVNRYRRTLAGRAVDVYPASRFIDRTQC
jgi:hypothetical protein